METKDFIENLGISVDDNNFEVRGNTYTLALANSDEFADIYSFLSTSNTLEFSNEDSLSDEHSTMFKYYGEGFDVELDANYDSDVYKFVVKKE